MDFFKGNIAASKSILSSVDNLLRNILQINKDFEGGISWFQMSKLRAMVFEV